MITDLDLLAPMPDPELLLSQAMGTNLDFGNTTLPDWDNSQFLSGSIEQPRLELGNLEEDDLGLDFGEDLEPATIFDEGTSIERGRNAPLERRASEEFGTELKDVPEDDLGLDFGDDLTELPPAPEVNLGDDMDITMGNMPDMDMPVEPSLTGDAGMQLAREESPLSELGEEEATRLAQEVAEQDATMFEPQPEEEESIHQARAKRRRVIGQDAETMLSTATLREQQQNREKILKPPSFLPRDPLLMALINMQRSGGFVSNILGDGRSQGWAPELRGILSLEVVSRPSQKRKRDSGVADLGTEDEEAAVGAEKTPQLEFELDDPTLGDMSGIGGETSIGGGGGDDDIVQLPSDPIEQAQEEEDFNTPIPDNFDDTTAPLIYPAESGPVSLETKHAVHLLRERFGPEAEESESQRQKNSIVFQDMLPENRTSRKDATKMFFEVLVLATKDAIKVEQPTNELGGPIRIRAKRGLWGEWAETGASGEMATQTQTASQAEADVPADDFLQGSRQVSVAA
jgi:cohesin complex subunit SCC1